MQDYSINELIEKISSDTIIIPKSVAFRKDVYEESKTLFGVVFTECVNDLRSYGSFIDGKTVGKMMKDYVMDMTIPDILPIEKIFVAYLHFDFVVMIFFLSPFLYSTELLPVIQLG